VSDFGLSQIGRPLIGGIRRPVWEDGLHFTNQELKTFHDDGGLLMTQLRRRFQGDRYVRMLFRQLPGAVWTTDRDLCLTYVSGRLALDVSLQIKPGMSVFDVLDTREPTNPVIARHRAAIAGEPQSFEYEFKGRWYKVFIEQITEDKGDAAGCIGCIGAAFDITDQRATQERLVRSEALLAQAQRVAHIGSFEWEIATNSVTWSDELHRIYGLEPGHFGGTYESFSRAGTPGRSRTNQKLRLRCAPRRFAAYL
jgi:PAS domain-containing protein